MAGPRKLMDVRELAEYLGVSPNWVYTQVEARAIPHTRLPGEGTTASRRMIRFTEEHAKQIIAAGEEPVQHAPSIALVAERRRAALRRDPMRPGTGGRRF